MTASRNALLALFALLALAACEENRGSRGAYVGGAAGLNGR